MAIQLSDTARNDRLDSIEATIGASPTLHLFTGTQPNDCSLGDSGTEVVEITLPENWMTAAAGGSKVKTGDWSDTASASGTVGYYRIKSSGGTCHLQGSVTITGGGGDMTLDNNAVATGQTVTIASFSLSDANA